MLKTPETQPKPADTSKGASQWKLTLRARLMLLVVLAMLPAIVVTVDMSLKQRHHLEANAQRTVLAFVRSAVSQHGLLIDETQQLFEFLEEMPAARESHSNDCRQVLKELLFGNRRYANFGVIQPDGAVNCSGVQSDTPINLADRSYFRTAVRTKRLSIGDYQIGRFVKKPVQIIAHPILNAEKQVQSVVYAALNLDWLTKLVLPAALPPDASVTLVDRHDVILARTPDPEVRWTGTDLGNEVPLVPQFIKSGRNEWVTEGNGVDGVRRIFALARLGPVAAPYGYIMVGIPSGPLYAPVNAQLLSHFSLVGAAFVAIMLLAWFGSDALILRRVRMLASATRQIRSGDFSVRTTIKGHDEIAHLASEFNQMAVMLQTDHRHIQRLNRIHEVLSGINGAILRIRERDALLQEACRIAVENGQLRFAWIDLADTTTGEMRNAAWHGDGKTYIHDLCLPILHGETSECAPCAIAIRNDHAVIHNDVEREKENEPFLEQAFANGFRSMAAFPLRRDGRVIGILALYAGEANFFERQETDLFLELAADISLGLEYIDKDQHIAHMLYHDALTGLPNRRLCEDRLQQLIARANHNNRYIGVVVANVTGFRRVAGIYGNHIADQVLNIISKRLLGQVRKGDTIARLEGDEFAIILNDMSSMKDAIHLAQSQIMDIPAIVQCEQQEIHLAIHAGAAIYPGDGEDAISLLKNATLASTDGKASQLHSVNFFSPVTQQIAQEREQLEHALRHAIEAGLELELHYQPVVDISTHQIVSLEALARWNSPIHGSVSPARFIPIAEESGLIIPLGNWALSTACRQIEAWHHLGITGKRIAVNVSYHQLREPGFIEGLSDMIETMAPHLRSLLAIELTESELMDNIEMTIAQLKALKERSIETYIDDFGTGYSSLSYLQRLPVHVLKIDQSFVQQLGTSGGSTAIVRTIIALAKSLDLKTIAEGVETQGQLDLLQQLDCDYAQGYLFSKPKPASEITQLLELGDFLVPSLKSASLMQSV